MKSPFSIYFWLLGHDVRTGDLQRFGFDKQPHPKGIGTSLYRKGLLWLHSFGLRIDTPAGIYIYDRRRDSFYLFQQQSASQVFPPLESVCGAERVSIQEGWRIVSPFYREYERTIGHWRGNGYRYRVIHNCPPLLRPFRKRILSLLQQDF